MPLTKTVPLKYKGEVVGTALVEVSGLQYRVLTAEINDPVLKSSLLTDDLKNFSFDPYSRSIYNTKEK